MGFMEGVYRWAVAVGVEGCLFAAMSGERSKNPIVSRLRAGNSG
jgi:hypothetical protein